MNRDRERWRDVTGYEGTYQVSSWGNLRHRPPHNDGLAWRSIRLSREPGCAAAVTLRRGPERTTLFVAHLVLTAFVGPQPSGGIPQWISGDRTDDSVDNLRWGHPEQLPRRARRAGNKPGLYALTPEEVAEVVGSSKGLRALARQFHVSPSTIHKARRMANQTALAKATPVVESASATPAPGGETWKSVVGYESYYEVSDLGRVRSLSRESVDRQGALYSVEGQMLSPGINSGGYSTVILCREGTRRSFAVARLVLEAFVGPRPPGLYARHKSTDYTDDRLVNLSWRKPGRRPGTGKLTPDQILLIRGPLRHRKAHEVAEEFGVSPSTIQRARK